MEDKEAKQPLLPSDNHHDSDTESSDGVNYDSCHDTLSTSPLAVANSVNVKDDDKYASNGPLLEKLPPGPRFHVYKRRWYMLVMYSLFGFTQSAVWNTWGPISTTCEEAFGWTDETIAWLSNWGCVSFVAAGLFFPWLLDAKGLRWATLSSMLCITLGCACRVITSEPGPATILIHFGQMLNGLAGPIAMCAIPQISALWFPPNERVTATAIVTSINSFGVAVAFILGPYFVSGGPPDLGNSNGTTDSTLLTTESPNVTDARKQEERAAVMIYMYYECAWSVLLFIAILIYFPAKPKHPPCVSAALERVDYWPGLWSLRKKGYYQVIAITYGLSVGVLTSWGSVLNMNLRPLHKVSENEAGWIGFHSIVGGCIAPLFVMRFADAFARRMKVFILIIYVLGSACFLALPLMLIDIIPYSRALLYTTIVGGTTLINVAVPMIFEVACELAYPCSEGAANGILTFLNNFVGLAYLAVFAIPNVGIMWMNWALFGFTVVCIPMIALIKGRFNRLEVDEGVNPEVYVEQEVEVPQDYTVQGVD
ncbi:hypothetical protein BsWGS_25631 [Bradybaena similaris]